MSYFSLFQSTHPARGATRSGFLTPTVDQFQSTHPARGATIAAISSGLSTSFQSTHPARGATVRRPPFCFHFDISIHAPREGSRLCPTQRWWHVGNFNPRTPRGVRRSVMRSSICSNSISIHAPREGCDERPCCTSRLDAIISIHAPREGCDYWDALALLDGAISIHAPREGCDLARTNGKAGAQNFNPRTPRGVRPTSAWPLTGPSIFQSTHPARGATVCKLRAGHGRIISIHAPREGCDQPLGHSD